MENIKEEKAREIIDKYIKSLNSLEMSSVKYFMETGHLSGSFYSAIKDVIKAGFEAGKQERDREIKSKFDIDSVDFHFKEAEKIMIECGFDVSNAELYLIVNSIINQINKI